MAPMHAPHTPKSSFAQAHNHGTACGHAHAHSVPSSRRALVLGMVFNLLFVSIEALVAWRTQSLALWADAVHNLSDVAGLALAAWGLWAAQTAPSAQRSYGFKRASIAATWLNALLLLAAMGWLGWEALVRLRSPSAVPLPGGIVMIVALIGVAINGGTALLLMRNPAHDSNIRAAFLHMLADAAVSAAVVVTGGLTLVWGWHWPDPVASLLIAAVVIFSAWRLLAQSTHQLLDGVPAHIAMDEVLLYLKSRPGVVAVSDLHIWSISSTDVALSAHLLMPAAPASDVLVSEINDALQNRFGIGHVTLQTTRKRVTAGCTHFED
jgi:cobalt-zinc-cadmium efflux system protein